MKIEYNPADWRLFIDSSSKSLKAVLLHNKTDGNHFPFIPVAHSILLKEDYKSTQLVLEKLEYHTHLWEVIGDFMVGFLMGLQGGYTKYPCFMCHFDSRDEKNHYKKKIGPNGMSLLRVKKMLNIYH